VRIGLLQNGELVRGRERLHDSRRDAGARSILVIYVASGSLLTSLVYNSIVKQI